MKETNGRLHIPISDYIPFADVQHLFKEGDQVIVTEKIRSNTIYICRDVNGGVHVTSKRLGKLGLLLPEYLPETLMEKLGRWAMGRHRKRNYFWQAAYNSGIIGALKTWPNVGFHIEIFGTVIPSFSPGFNYAEKKIPQTVLIERVSFDGKDQGHGSFLRDWTPLFHIGKWEAENCLPLAIGNEAVSGKKLHVRDGIVVRHAKLKYLTDGRPLIAAVYPNDVEAWAKMETVAE